MRIHIGNDHAGFELARHATDHLIAAGHEVVNHGPETLDPSDDYPLYCITTAKAVMRDIGENTPALGIVIGGSGNGEQISANKVRGARVALAWNDETARLARAHNDANLVAIGARQHTQDQATALIDAFIDEPFSAESRHMRRIAQVVEFEVTGRLGGESLDE